jgi:hypothetical protein
MKTIRRRKRIGRRVRRGRIAVDVVLSLAVFFTIAMTLFGLCAMACNRLHHVISNLVGFPYS